MARTRTQVRHTVPFTTSLHPAAAAALAALADREPDGHASGVISRLVRAELDRLAPGAWDAAMQDVARDPQTASIFDPRIGETIVTVLALAERTRTPAERAASAATVIREALGRGR